MTPNTEQPENGKSIKEYSPQTQRKKKIPTNELGIGDKISHKFELNRRNVLKATAALSVGLGGIGAFTGTAAAAPGDLLGEVVLPQHNRGVGITFDGQYVYTVDGLVSSVLQVYEPPSGGNGTATLLAEKAIVDNSENSVEISGFDWDPTREKMWSAHRTATSPVYLIDIGDPTDASQNAVAEFQFNATAVSGAGLMDGVAYVATDDRLWLSGDVNSFVHVYQTDGTDLGGFDPVEADGSQMELISGLAVGAQQNGRPTAFIGRNGLSKISRVYADNGEFIEDFANLPFRVEDLTCDPITYAPNEAILTKDAYDGFYVAFEVQPGTCPLPQTECPSVETRLLAGQDIEIGTVTVTENGDEISVTYSLTDDWYMTESHLHIADNCDDIPQTRSGNPKVGRFEHARDYDPAVQEDTYVINQADEGFESGDALCIAAHAAVFQDANGNDNYDPNVDPEEAAWAEGDRFTEKGNWAMHFEYVMCD